MLQTFSWWRHFWFRLLVMWSSPDVPSLIADRRHSLFGHMSPTGERTCFAGTATVNRSPHRHSSRCWLEAPAGSFTEKLAAASGRRHWPICWCCLDRGPGSFDVEDATTLSWSSAAVSEWVVISAWPWCIFPYNLVQDIYIQSRDTDIFLKFKMAAAAIFDFQFMWIWPFRRVHSVVLVFCTKFGSKNLL